MALNAKVKVEKEAEDVVFHKTTALDENLKNLEKQLADREKVVRTLEPVSCDSEALNGQQAEVNVRKSSISINH